MAGLSIPSCSTIIVVPCYNEEQRLRPDAFIDFARKHPGICFLFVNDGSSDRTEDVLARLAKQLPAQLAFISLRKNSGKAEAVRRGLITAMRDYKASFIGYWDADLATPLTEMPALLELVEKDREVDLAMGSRVNLLGRKIRRKKTRHYAGRIFATMASCYLRMPVYDTQCGAKIFRVNRRTRQLFHKRFETNWLFDVEILARYVMRLRRTGETDIARHIRELPLNEWEDVHGSKLKMLDFPRALLHFIKIMRTYGWK